LRGAQAYAPQQQAQATCRRAGGIARAARFDFKGTQKGSFGMGTRKNSDESDEDAARNQEVEDHRALGELRKAARAELIAEGLSEEVMRNMQYWLDEYAAIQGRRRH
jgi:hypothetical protein